MSALVSFMAADIIADVYGFSDVALTEGGSKVARKRYLHS